MRAAVRASREDSSTPDLKVVRVHVFLDEKGRKDFVRRLKNPEDAIANGVRQYRDLYTDPDICLYRVDWCDKGIRFFGEYIIYDSQIMLIYDRKFKTLQILCGSIAETFAKPFKEIGDEDDYNICNYGQLLQS